MTDQYGQNYNQDFYQSNFTLEPEVEHNQYNVPPQQWVGMPQQYPPMDYSNPAHAPPQPPSGGGGYPSYSQGWGEQGHVQEMETEPVVGSLGSISTGPQPPQDYFGASNTGFEDEPPLLVELGIDFSVIKDTTLSVLNPMKAADAGSLRNTDLAGPLLFCLLFGGVLLLSGKVHFGYIYGVGVIGCLGLFAVLNLMSTCGVSVSCVISVLGYCLLPMVLLSAISVIFSLQGIAGTILTLATICWCSFSASKLFVSVLDMHSQQPLVAYPCALLYGVFALLTVF